QQQQQQQSDVGRNRAYSQSIYSYDELNNFTNDANATNRNALFHRIDEDDDRRSPTIQSSTISIPNDLNYDDDSLDNMTSSHPEEPAIENNRSNESKTKKTTFQSINSSSTQPLLNMVEPRIDLELDWQMCSAHERTEK
ncbi:hypothetical protein BLA29_010202, partial [Euroglyphus maynei]